MPCNCNKGAAAATQAANRQYRVKGTGDPKVDKTYSTETAAQMALATSGKSGTVEPV